MEIPLFHDDECTFDPGEKNRAGLFLSTFDESSFSEWPTERNPTWREMQRAKRKACDSYETSEYVHLPLVKHLGTEARVFSWLQARKDQWRTDRAKRRRCDGSIQKGAMKCVSETLHQHKPQAAQWRSTSSEHPLMIYTGFKLQRESIKEPWGIRIFHPERCFLVVDHVSDTARSRTNWKWATVTPTSGTLMAITDELISRAFFESQPLHSSSVLHLERGDMIISIDGHPISFFASLSDIADYMRKTTNLFIITLRHQQAQEAAQTALNHRENDARVVRDWSHHIPNDTLQYTLPPLYNTSNVASLLFPNHHAKPAFDGQDPSIEVSRTSNTDKNIWFQDEDGILISFEDEVEFDLEDGSRACIFLPTISSFPSWLEKRKGTWRKRWARDVRGWSHHVSSAALQYTLPLPCNTPKFASLLFPYHHAKPAFYGQDLCHELSRTPNAEKNLWFRDENGIPMSFEDNVELDLHDGRRACGFLPTISSFPSWLEKRKVTWRKRWDIRSAASDSELYSDDYSSPSVSSDFWTCQGYPTFQNWLAASTFKWKQRYTWNRKKREMLEKERDEVVQFPSNCLGREAEAAEQMRHWLRVRKQQWRFLRRKRQRRLEDKGMAFSLVSDDQNDQKTNHGSDSSLSKNDVSIKSRAASNIKGPALISPRSAIIPRQTSSEMVIIDAVLEEQERRNKALQERPPLDISFLFDDKHGAPDDVVAHCLKFLHCSEHGKLLCVNRATSMAMKDRDGVWSQLCPTHWVLPRRPRKRWHEFYVTKIREEEEASKKWSDGFLTKANDILLKADHLNKIEKLVVQGEKQLGFDINYTSGVVCERNSLLNLAVIYSRPKVVRWLLETKGANIETCDRGNFTPLLNAAWAGDRYLVRFLLSHGANRTKLGFCHFFEPLASPEFKGLNAEGWARKRGHHDLANLIRVGL